MNETYIVTVYYVIDETLKMWQWQDDQRSTMTAAEVLTVAIIAAKYFQNHHERALCLLAQTGTVFGR